MVQPGRPWGWGRRSPARPGIEADVVMVAAGREEHRIAAVAGRDLEAEHVAIERNGAVEIGHRQMNVANSGLGVDHIADCQFRIADRGWRIGHFAADSAIRNLQSAIRFGTGMLHSRYCFPPTRLCTL